MEIEINKNMLVWAVKRSGKNFQEIEDKFPKFNEWVDGKKKPTIIQLKNFAKKVYVPFGYLFLKTPPKETLPFPFYRTNVSEGNDISLNLYDTIKILQKRQEWLVEYLKENEYLHLDFVGKFKNSNDFNGIVADIRKKLEMDENWASNFNSWEAAKEYLSKKIEDIGIVATFNSIVGNNSHRSISVDECRGFVIVNKYAPFLFINSADSKAAQMFTLIHELAHIWIGESAGFDFRNMQPAENEIEKFCDKIAAEFLVPSFQINEIWKKINNLEKIARHFKVSQIVIARRLLDLNLINKIEYFDFYNNYINREIKKKVENEGGGDFYNTQRKRLSVRFLTFVDQAIKENKLLVRDAYNITSMKGNTFQNMMREHLY